MRVYKFSRGQKSFLVSICVYNNVCCTSSKLKRTPPIGAPKATDTPAADAAERTWEDKTNAPQLTLNTVMHHNNIIFCLTPSPLVSWPRSCCTLGRGRRRCSHSSRPRGPGGPPSPGWGRTPQPAPEWWSWSSGSTCLGSPGWWTHSGWSWSTEGRRRLNRKPSLSSLVQVKCYSESRGA